MIYTTEQHKEEKEKERNEAGQGGQGEQGKASVVEHKDKETAELGKFAGHFVIVK